MAGIVIRIQGNIYTVQSDSHIYACTLRGKLKREKKAAQSLVVVGDRVDITPVDPETGVIEEILPRHSKFSRISSGNRAIEQIIVANLDQIIAFFAADKPEPSLEMIDRFMVIAESQMVKGLICINKCDLVFAESLRKKFAVYEKIGYPVIFTSTKTGEGINRLKDVLKEKISIFAGPSGVGKSTMLNKIQPGLGLKVKTISLSTGKGRHTTTHVSLNPLEFGGWVGDTPGIRELGLWGIPPEDIPQLFPEIRSLEGFCRFHNCQHITEPDCIVKKAVEDGAVDPRRYESFIKLSRGEVVDF